MKEHELDALTEALLETPFQVIDFLPRQVSAQRADAYFAAEDFFTERPRLEALYERFAELLVKLGCYFDFALYMEEGWMDAPTPRQLHARIVGCAGGGWCSILFPAEEALITFSGGDLYMTLYHASPALSETVRQLASAAGLFLRNGE